MSFLSPLFLIGAAAAAIPILLHLLKRRPDARVLFSAVHLLRQAPIEHAARRRLRELLLLALRVTALGLLAVAFARPFLAAAGDLGATGTTMVLIDTSLSMSVPGRFERAREQAKEIVAATPAGHAVGVVSFNDRAEIVERPSNNRARAVAAIDAAQAGAGATHFRGALAAASGWLRGGDDRLVVITDLQASGWDEGESASIPDSARVEIVDVGGPAPNLAVTRLEVAGARLVGSVANNGPGALDAKVSVRAGRGDATTGGEAGTPVTVAVAAGQSSEFSVPRPDGAWAAAVVDDSAGAPLDNARFVVLGNAARPTVLVVTSTGDLDREALYLHQALIAGGADGSAYQVDGVAGAALQSWDQGRINRYQAIVIQSTRGLDHHGRGLLAEYQRQGGGLLIPASADVDGEVIAEVLGGTRVAMAPPAKPVAGAAERRALAPEDARHPVLQVFDGRSSLALVVFRQVASIRADGCRALARFTTGETAMLDCGTGSGRALLLAFDLSNTGNDFPLHPTFLPFVHQSVRYLVGIPRGRGVFVADAPGGQRTPGVVMLPAAGGLPQPVAVNFDPAEADPTRLTVEEFQSAVTRLKTVPLSAPRSENGDLEERQRLWRYALVAVLALLVAESLLATKAA